MKISMTGGNKPPKNAARLSSTLSSDEASSPKSICSVFAALLAHRTFQYASLGARSRPSHPIVFQRFLKKSRLPGLTLLEVLISVAIFALAAVVLSQTFISFNRLHRQVSNKAVLAGELRTAMELLVRETRNKRVNYDSISGYVDAASVASSTSLHLVDASGGTTDVEVRADVCGEAGVRCLAMQRSSVPGGWQPITGKHVDVTSFGVYIRPTTNPFARGSSVNIQPLVTFHLGVAYLTKNPKDGATLEAQTAVSTRIYER